MWQTPGVGEEVMKNTTTETIVPAFVADGMSEEVANDVASHIDDRMKAAILPLYRSAVNVGKEWGPALDGIDRPGLVIWGEKDIYMQLNFAQKMAARTKAKLITFPGGHWWPVQFPKETAKALEEHWASV